jgi:pimeloyl-ACP methyl ester carboxylesterase
MTDHLVLLPGMDGTGQLFAGFRAALPDTTNAIAVAYPENKFLSYSELHPIVRAAIPIDKPFVLLAESFSTPLVLEYAASNPPNLVAVVICCGFVSKPIGMWSQPAQALARPWLFRMMLSRWVIEHFLLGPNASPALIHKLRQVIKSVNPAVMSRRMRQALLCDARDALAQTSVPIMYIRAAQDNLLAKSCLNDFRRIRPDIFFEQVEGPHLLLQREPHRVADLVLKFIQRVGS